MANLSFTRGTLEKVNLKEVIDGQLLIATDVGQLFVDVASERVPINDIIKVTTLGEATEANVNKVYYATETNVLAVSNGVSWTQINAQQIITEGKTNGTISVGGVDVPVHGLGSAAYVGTETFDAAGSANAVKTELLGDVEDTSAELTIYGVQKLANEKVKNVVSADASIEVGGTTTDPTIKVTISQDEDNALTLADDGLKVSKGAAPAYTIVKAAVATEGYIATYELQKDGVPTGEKINIPKDYLVKSASVKEAVGDSDPSGLPAGTKYIDFIINSVDGGGNESHVYLNVNDLVDAYTAGNGIEISVGNEVSVKVVAENGLSVDGSGIAMALASGSSAGAMSSAHFTKLEGIATGAEVNYVKSVTAPFSVSPEGQLSATDANTGASGLMSGADKTSLDDLKTNAIKTINFNGTPVAVSDNTATINLVWTDLE